MTALRTRLWDRLRLSRWLVLGEWRAHPLRALVAVIAIMVGVAMGFAVHLVNAAAFNEFRSAIASVAGQADVQVVGRERWFDEAIYPHLASLEQVAQASPVLELAAPVPGASGALQVLGIDALRAAAVVPDLVGVPQAGRGNDLVADDAIFLSPGALSWLGRRSGEPLVVRSGTKDVRLRVAGTIARARSGQRVAVMDIGAAQWRFGRLGQLSRIDLKLRDGVDSRAFARTLQAQLERDWPGRFSVEQVDDPNQQSRSASLSRAYRVNLTVLALVALLTGAFLVFSSQALSVMRRRSQFALLRVIGVQQRGLERQLLLEGMSLGVLGSLLGIGAGYALAHAVLGAFGGDLGAGYFAGTRPQLVAEPGAALVFFLLGVAVALLGSLVPARSASRAPLAESLKAGADVRHANQRAPWWPSLAALILAAGLALAPPVFELPLFAYAAVALLLIGGIGLLPRTASSVFRRVETSCAPLLQRHPMLSLAVARLANAPGQAALALGGIVASFSLMVAMAIMVASFRDSVDQWMAHILPAELYVRTSLGGNTGSLDANQQAAIGELPAVRQVQFLVTHKVTLDATRAPVVVVARDIDPGTADSLLLLVGEQAAVPAGARPAWVSEAILDLYGARVGQQFDLPLGGSSQRFFVAGVWRDYANQGGSIVIQRSHYSALTGQYGASDVALWSKDGDIAALERQLAVLPFAPALSIVRPATIRSASLAIFDRSFAVTYLLEVIAIGVGLAGVAASFSAQTLARSREFGMLRHIGVSRRQVLGLLGLEAGLVTGLGIGAGFVLGLLISLILVYVVNPQSFHWTMQLHVPWLLTCTVAALLALASVATALLSGRHALSIAPVRAVREDW